ncbi:unnamed protein product, partial [Ilex paraguariensis]
GVQDLLTIIAAANGPVDFKTGGSQGPFKRKKREGGSKKDRYGTSKDAEEANWKKKSTGVILKS